MATYKKLKTNVKEKKAAKEREDKAEQKAIIEERREWNLALANSKSKPIQAMRKVEPFNRNKRTIERIEELLESE